MFTTQLDLAVTENQVKVMSCTNTQYTIVTFICENFILMKAFTVEPVNVDA